MYVHQTIVISLLRTTIKLYCIVLYRVVLYYITQYSKKKGPPFFYYFCFFYFKSNNNLISYDCVKCVRCPVISLVIPVQKYCDKSS